MRKFVLLDPNKFRYLDSLIDPEVEVDNKEKKKRADAVLSLTWLKRIMDFIHHFLSNFVLEVRLPYHECGHLCRSCCRNSFEFMVKHFLSQENMTCEDLRPLFREAYELKLKKHHNVVAHKLFQVG